MADASKRPTGSIPLSWARPAEDVTALPAPASKAPTVAVVVVLLLAAGVCLAVVSGVGPGSAGGSTSLMLPPPVVAPPRQALPEPPSPKTTTATTATTLPPPTTPATAPAPIAAAPEPAVANPAIAPEDDDAVTGRAVPDASRDAVPDAGADGVAAASAVPVIDEARRLRAQVFLKAARQAAKKGDEMRALHLAEDAIDKDPRCYECWQTVSLLRKRAGDVEGARIATRTARALAPPK